MMLSSPFLDLPQRALASFCTRWDVGELTLTGSALHGPFAPDSDIDFVFQAPREASIYTAFGAPRREALAELTDIVGRRVDLVCPRQVLASANPYAIHNLLADAAAPRVDRFAGLAWYLGSAAGLLGALARDRDRMFASHLRRVALLRIARIADRPERLASWAALGLDITPIARVHDVVGPVLRAMRAFEPPRWPEDAALDALARAVEPHVESIVALTTRLIRETPPPRAPGEAVVQLAFHAGERLAVPILVAALSLSMPTYVLDAEEILRRTRREGERLALQPLVVGGERYVLHTVLLPFRTT